MNLICLDFETFYSNDFTLRKLTTESYIRDPRFEALLIGWATPDGQSGYVEQSALPAFLADVVPNAGVVMHHAHFDGLILSHHFGVKPAFIFDTLSMGRQLHGTSIGLSLAKLAEHYGLSPKTVPYDLFIGKRWVALDAETRRLLGEGAAQDCALTMEIFRQMLPQFPKEELLIVDTTVRMFTEPCLVGDAALFAELRDEEFLKKNELLYALDVGEKDLASADKFCAILEREGVDIEYKAGKNGDIPAIAATDQFMRDMAAGVYGETVAFLAEARLNVKSTIAETRCGRLHEMATRGALPVYLNYCGAHTTRWSGGDKSNMQNMPRGSRMRTGVKAPDGFLLCPTDQEQGECIAHGQMVLTLSGAKPIQDVELTDLVFDGVEYVRHEGLVCKGEREVITYQGLTATPDHNVYCRVGGSETRVSLLAAARMGLDLAKPENADAVRQETMREPQRRGVQDLRRAGGSVSFSERAGSGFVHLEDVAASVLQRCGDRQDRQQQALRAGEFATLDAAQERQQPLHNFLGSLPGDAAGDARFSSGNRMQVQPGPSESAGRSWSDGRTDFGAVGDSAAQAAKSESWEAPRALQKARVYDLINAGPRHRFVASGVLVSNCRVVNWLGGQDDVLDNFRQGKDPYVGIASKFYGFEVTKAHKKERGTGKQLELSCGFGAGAATIIQTAKRGTYGPPVYLTDLEGERAKSLYRDTHPGVVALWKEGKDVLRALSNRETRWWGPLLVKDGLIVLPNGGWIDYSSLEWIADEETGKRGWKLKSRKGWTWTHGAKLVENVVQALSRVITSQAMIKVRNAGYHIVMSSHDDFVPLVPIDGHEVAALLFFEACMSETPAWAPGLPLAASGKLGATYD
jgi:hypothetical protein